MTSLTLLLWILAAVAVQLAVFIGIAFWRHWQEYAALKAGAPEYVAVPPLDAPLPNASWTGYRTFTVTEKIAEDSAQQVCSFHLAPLDEKPLPPFLPGQYLTFALTVPATGGGTEEIVRCYSLSDAPHPDHYRVSIKRVPPPTGSDVAPGRSSNYFHDHVKVGSQLQVRAPAGHFHLDRGDAPVVLVGGGIGITPLLSMLEGCMTDEPTREVWLFYGVRNGRECVMKAQLDALAAANPNFHFWPCFSAPLPEDQTGRDFRHRGRVDVSLLRQQLPLKPYHFYICGPTPMMQSLVSDLEEWGVPEARIHFEAFGPASIQRKRAAVEREESASTDILVTFARSGKQLAWQSGATNLLEFAEANGIAISSGCRGGACGTCQTAIRSGEVSYLQTPDHDPEPGTCLLCVCVPKTSVVLEA